jgi:di/tricarboxylate transporter
VLAINRQAEVITEDVRLVKLELGDSLVSHSTWKDLAVLANEKDFIVATDVPQEEMRPDKVAPALFFFSISLGMILFSDFQLSVSLLVGAMGMVISRVLTMDEAYSAISWKTVFLLASLIPLGQAMLNTGTAAWIAQESLAILGHPSDLMLQIMLAVMATLFSLVMSNVGATTILVPIAISIALATNGNPLLYALIIGLSTSNAFIIPTHQVNALIMGPGGYKVKDYVRVGSIMSVLFLVVMLTVLNLLY